MRYPDPLLLIDRAK